MLYLLNKKDKQTISIIVNYFCNVYPKIPYIKMYNRIFCGYCWGEGGSRIISIKEWEQVFNYTKLGKMLFTVFKNWEEYNQYNGDYHLKIKNKKH